MQRFVSEDPIEFAGGDPNLYAYTGNNPTNFIDPSGNFVPQAAVAATLCAAGAAAGAASAYALAGRKVSFGGLIAGTAGGCAAGVGIGWGIGIAVETMFPSLMLAGGQGVFWDGFAAGLGAQLASTQAAAIGAATIHSTFTGSALLVAGRY